MQRPTEITSEAFTYGSDFTQVNVGDTVDGMWGYRELTISADDIMHLIRGGCLYYSDGEYASVVTLAKGE